MGWNKIRSTMFSLTKENASPVSDRALSRGSPASADLSGTGSPSPEAEGSAASAGSLEAAADLSRTGGPSLEAKHSRPLGPKAEGDIIFKGKGSGHGVGMCQWGAQGMASKGASYREILLHYYPKTKIKTR